jgi:hypothetical protein
MKKKSEMNVRVQKAKRAIDRWNARISRRVGEASAPGEKPYTLGMASGEPCHLCHRRVRQIYMLHDHVWAQTGAPFVFGNMHIGCVERRLGRRLTKRDFYYQDRGGVKR